ncbi:MAG: type II toxin-antitoxin system VapC family toxin [Methanobacteriaceae archaeon]|nr:type II toxin-antitoxin system VapC family toxin [Methanobacteriaceae archaeon]
MSKIFLDTNFILGLLLANDSTHYKALKLKETKKIFQNDCYISNHVLDEIITLTSDKSDYDNVIKTYFMIKDNFTILNEYHISNFNDKVMNTYYKFNNKLSFTDYSIIKVMKENNIKQIVTFDKEFKRCEDIEIIT